MKVKISGLLLLLLVFTLGACSQPKQLVYQDVENFKLQSAGINNTQLSLDIRLYNPNHYKLKLKSADVDVFLNGTHLGKMEVTEKFVIPKEDTCALPVTLNVDLKNVLPNVLQLVMNSIADIKLTGTIRAGRHGIYITVPVDYETKQDIGQVLKF